MVPGDRRGGCDQVRQKAEASRYSFNNPLPPTINSRNAPPSLPEPIERLATACANQLFAVSVFSVLSRLFLLIFTRSLASSVIVVINVAVVTTVIIVFTTFARCFSVALGSATGLSFRARARRVANRKNCESGGGELLITFVRYYLLTELVQPGWNFFPHDFERRPNLFTFVGAVNPLLGLR